MLPDDAGSGATLARAADAASEWMRPGLTRPVVRSRRAIDQRVPTVRRQILTDDQTATEREPELAYTSSRAFAPGASPPPTACSRHPCPSP